ncbi:MAG: hypothetical protein IT342_06305 [Candidatus Melainabacteria bacterium]|nr:hypothetical protein [Candidatus Melainabacteria bacterium]
MFLKPSQVFQGAIAKPADVARNCLHMLRMLALKLAMSKPDKYLPSLNVGGVEAQWATAADGRKITCMYCQHAIARLTFADGWVAETCSAQGLSDMLNAKHTAQWVEKLHTLYEICEEPETMANTGDLQRTQ